MLLADQSGPLPSVSASTPAINSRTGTSGGGKESDERWQTGKMKEEKVKAERINFLHPFSPQLGCSSQVVEINYWSIAVIS